MVGDVLSLDHVEHPGEPLIHPVMQNGRRTRPPPALSEIRARAAADLERLPEPLRRLDPNAKYPVVVADALMRLAREVDTRLAKQRPGVLA
jgi:nicotinate phosphoribosyltransferase